jgi:hypothetical protein
LGTALRLRGPARLVLPGEPLPERLVLPGEPLLEPRGPELLRGLV